MTVKDPAPSLPRRAASRYDTKSVAKAKLEARIAAVTEELKAARAEAKNCFAFEIFKAMVVEQQLRELLNTYARKYGSASR